MYFITMTQFQVLSIYLLSSGMFLNDLESYVDTLFTGLACLYWVKTEVGFVFLMDFIT